MRRAIVRCLRFGSLRPSDGTASRDEGVSEASSVHSECPRVAIAPHTPFSGATSYTASAGKRARAAASFSNTAVPRSTPTTSASLTR